MICPFKYPLTMDFPASHVCFSRAWDPWDAEALSHPMPGPWWYLGSATAVRMNMSPIWICWLNHGLRWNCLKSRDIFIHVAGGFRSFFAYFILGVIWCSLDLTDIERDEYDAPACGKVIWFRFQLLILWGYQPQNSFPKVSAKKQVVYYMQIKDQLPSLHRLMEWSQKDYQILNDYAWNFVSLEDAKQAARNGSRRYEGGRPWEVSISWASKVGFGSTCSTSASHCRWYVLRDCFVSLQCQGPHPPPLLQCFIAQSLMLTVFGRHHPQHCECDLWPFLCLILAASHSLRTHIILCIALYNTHIFPMTDFTNIMHLVGKSTYPCS